MTNIIVIPAGLISLYFGYCIYFKKKYHLLKRFKEDYEAGRKDEQYAKRVGLIEFIVGIVLLEIGIIIMSFD